MNQAHAMHKCKVVWRIQWRSVCPLLLFMHILLHLLYSYPILNGTSSKVSCTSRLLSSTPFKACRYRILNLWMQWTPTHIEWRSSPTLVVRCCDLINVLGWTITFLLNKTISNFWSLWGRKKLSNGLHACCMSTNKTESLNCTLMKA